MDLNTALLGAGGSAAALTALGALGRGAWRTTRRVMQIADAVQELSPNSGHSIKDTVTRTERTIDRTESAVQTLTARFDDHLRTHSRGA